MSILAECQPFARHGLGETQAKPLASGDGLSNNNCLVGLVCFLTRAVIGQSIHDFPS
jgi:hypothetical protein